MAKKTTAQVRRRAVGATRQRSSESSPRVLWHFPFNRENFMYFGIAIVVMIIGFAFMATGITNDEQAYVETWNNAMAVNIGPLLLVIAYCVLFPLAIMRAGRNGHMDIGTDENTTEGNQAEA